MRGIVRRYRAGIATVGIGATLVAVLFGPLSVFPYMMLSVVEVSFSFDNAIVNARWLVQMGERWQKLFLTLGLVIAVGGVRLVLPILVVMATAQLDFADVTRLALLDQSRYSTLLSDAHAQVELFGGTFLLLVFLDFIFGDDKLTWLRIEQVLVRFRSTRIRYLAAACIVLLVSTRAELIQQLPLLFTGLLSIATYALVHGLAARLKTHDEAAAAGKRRTGWAGLAAFLYLEVQDASFSLDGLIGAFAISNNVLLIAIALGIGAWFVRSLTIDLSRKGSQRKFIFLENGAYWAIGALAGCMLTSVEVEAPQFIVGLSGVLFIGAAVWHSIRVRPDQTEPQVAMATSG